MTDALCICANVKILLKIKASFMPVFILTFFTFFAFGEKALSEPVSETFLEKENKLDISSEIDSFSENYSWFFDSKKTKQEMAIVPVYFSSRIYSKNAGLRLFTYPTDLASEGYYFSVFFLKQILDRGFKTGYKYNKKYLNGLEIVSESEYSTYFQAYYGEGMSTDISNRKDLHAHRFSISEKVIFDIKQGFIAGFLAKLIFRNEVESLQDSKTYFDPELLFFGEVFTGFDSRNDKKNTTEGQYHQLSLACVPALASSFCRSEADLRFYSRIKTTYTEFFMALRGLYGEHFFGPSSYSTAYSLGGRKELRGFVENRFRGDRIYLLQLELRKPLYGKLLSSVLFTEIGEVASYSRDFYRPAWDYGVGLRLSLPPAYTTKVRFDLGISTEENTSQRINFIVDFHQAF